MDIAELAAVATLFGALVALIQWRANRAQAKSAELALLRDMSGDWLRLKPQWHRALLAVLGPDDYYSPATPEMRNRFGDVLTAMSSEPEPGTPEWHEWHIHTRAQTHEVEQAERDVIFFLASLASRRTIKKAS